LAYQLLTPVLSNERLQEKVFKLTLSSPLISRISRPGHFVHARVSSGCNPLLRRAFSIHSLNKNKDSFEILFRVIGKGTDILSQAYPGDTLDVLGPIGNRFSLPKKGQKIMLVAGGMGIAPLWFLFNHLIKRYPKDDLTFLVGAKNREELLYVEKLEKAGANLMIATDDGSAGRKGLVTEVFAQEIKRRGGDYRRLCVYSCGPQMMLKRMSQLARRRDFLCQISLETHMACGVGACWGCVVKLKDGTYKRVCVDGPVFDARVVDLA
jgi:dihydroorotate dehydrogenase electron transfer subunit